MKITGIIMAMSMVMKMTTMMCTIKNGIIGQNSYEKRALDSNGVRYFLFSPVEASLLFMIVAGLIGFFISTYCIDYGLTYDT